MLDELLLTLFQNDRVGGWVGVEGAGARTYWPGCHTHGEEDRSGRAGGQVGEWVEKQKHTVDGDLNDTEASGVALWNTFRQKDERKRLVVQTFCDDRRMAQCSAPKCTQKKRERTPS